MIGVAGGGIFINLPGMIREQDDRSPGYIERNELTMSGVKRPNKNMNVVKYDSFVYGTSKVIRHHTDNENYHKTKTLTD